MTFDLFSALSQDTPRFCTSCGVPLHPLQSTDAKGVCEHCVAVADRSTINHTFE
jgi:predicted RNA-binding Zn-ribbon protein involved in translation (DUF1610 family)